MAHHKLFLTHLLLYLCAFVSGYEFSRLVPDCYLFTLSFVLVSTDCPPHFAHSHSADPACCCMLDPLPGQLPGIGREGR